MHIPGQQAVNKAGISMSNNTQKLVKYHGKTTKQIDDLAQTMVKITRQPATDYQSLRKLYDRQANQDVAQQQESKSNV